MLNISWGEILLILIVAIVVIKPKDLPKIVSKLGNLMAKAHMYWQKFKLEISNTTKDD